MKIVTYKIDRSPDDGSYQSLIWWPVVWGIPTLAEARARRRSLKAAGKRDAFRIVREILETVE